jgi:hypothetical protein
MRNEAESIVNDGKRTIGRLRQFRDGCHVLVRLAVASGG